VTKALGGRFACCCHVINTGTESWRGSVERTRQTLTRLGNLRETYSTGRAA